MGKKIGKIGCLGCLLPVLLFLFLPIILIFAIISENSNKLHCNNSDIIVGGNIFAEDYVVLQGFGFTTWATGAGAFLYAGTGVGHTGIDIQPVNFRDFNKEDVGVYSVTNGTVQFVGFTTLGGNYVTVKMVNGKSAYYGHLKNTAVKIGDNIEIGTKLGNLGATGTTNIYHVHFEIQDNAPNLATRDSSEYLGVKKLNNGDVVRVSSKENIYTKKGST